MGYKIKGNGVLQVAGIRKPITSEDLNDEVVERLKKTNPKIVENMIEKDGGSTSKKKE